MSANGFAATVTTPANGVTMPGCAASIADAIAAAKGSAAIMNDIAATENISGGYRVVQQRWDAVLGVHWAMLEVCAHPEWPWRAVALRDAVKTGTRQGIASTVMYGETAQPVLVRAGDVVLLWSSDERVQMNLRATAETNGRAGQTIWLHLEVQMDGQAGRQRRRGIVRQAGRVEMVP